MATMCGVVDLGSNTVRLSIYRCETDGRRFQLLLNKKVMAGLAGYVEGGALSDSGILVACRTLSSFRNLLQNFSIETLHVFATASLRNITNTEQAIADIQGVTGSQIDLLSGQDEAELSFLGATSSADLTDGLLADIGGGSVELVRYQNAAIVSSCSLPLGSLSLYTKQVSGLFPTTEERKAMRNLVARELEKVVNPGGKCGYLCGVGGTIRGASKLVSNLYGKDVSKGAFTAEDVAGLYKQLKLGDKEAMSHILHVIPDRIHTILPGLTILNGILKAYGIEKIGVSPSGVREGYLIGKVLRRK